MKEKCHVGRGLSHNSGFLCMKKKALNDIGNIIKVIKMRKILTWLIYEIDICRLYVYVCMIGKGSNESENHVMKVGISTKLNAETKI